MLSRPKIVLAEKRKDLQNLRANIVNNQKFFLINTRGYLNHSVSMFKAFSLENTLQRGFAIVSYNGRIINDATAIKNGDSFTVQIKKTELTAILQNKITLDGK